MTGCRLTLDTNGDPWPDGCYEGWQDKVMTIVITFCVLLVFSVLSTSACWQMPCLLFCCRSCHLLSKPIAIPCAKLGDFKCLLLKNTLTMSKILPGFKPVTPWCKVRSSVYCAHCLMVSLAIATLICKEYFKDIKKKVSWLLSVWTLKALSGKLF